MAGKRKIASPKASPKKAEPKAKKAKVEVDPIAEACKALVKFFTEEGGLGDMEDAIEATVEPALYPAPADRHPLEQVFAKAVGDALKTAVTAIDGEVQKTQATQAAVNAHEAAATEGLDAATLYQKSMQQKVQAAKASERDAEEARNQAVETLETHQQSVKNLAGQKKKLEGEEAELAAGLELLKHSTGSKQDAKKLVALMKQVGASEAACAGLPNALGKTGGFEDVVLAEAAKVLGAAYTGVTEKQKNWEAHCTQMFTDTNNLLTAAKVGAETLASRQGESAGALEADKAAKKAKKEAENKLADAKKEVTSTSKGTAKAAQRKEAADWADAAYEQLYLRPAPVEEPAPDADAAADADASME